MDKPCRGGRDLDEGGRREAPGGNILVIQSGVNSLNSWLCLWMMIQ